VLFMVLGFRAVRRFHPLESPVGAAHVTG
jgi:hypothetical protein